MPKTLKIVLQDAEAARVETRKVLNEFEARYGTPSQPLMEVFVGEDGHVDETAKPPPLLDPSGRRTTW